MAKPDGPGTVVSHAGYPDAVDLIYAAAASPARWPEALHAIAGVFGDVGGIIVFPRGEAGFGTIVSPGLDVAQRDYVDSGWWRQDLRMLRALERDYIMTGEAVTERHLFTAEELETLPYYTEFLARHGLRWFAGASVSPNSPAGVVVSIQRRADKPPYSDDELSLFTRLCRHVEHSLRLSIRLINAELTGVALAEAFSRLSVGVFILDEHGSPVYANPAATRTLGSGLMLSDGRLQAMVRPGQEQFSTAIAAVLEGGGPAPGETPRPFLLHGGTTESYLAAYVLPVRHAMDTFLAGARAIVLVVVSDVREPDPAVLRDLLGLTLAEARIAALVGSGLPPRDTAGRLGISEETVRSTLKRVFEKTGVSRQSELALLITRLVLA